MFQCICCGCRSARPAYGWQAQGECFGFPAYEETRGCPWCGGGLELVEEEQDRLEEDAYD